MVPTAVITFREFLEAFLIIGVFLGISHSLGLKKELEISLAAITGVVLSFLFASSIYFFADQSKIFITEKNADYLESYLLIFSGLFLAYVVFSLHKVLRRGRGASLIKAHQKLAKNLFDFSLFLTIVFLVMREGFEIALFTASVSLFSSFVQNMLGLMIGFIFAMILGMLSFIAYVKFPIGKMFKITEYMIVLLGAALVQNGITILLKLHFQIDLTTLLSTPLHFLPRESTVAGHIIKTFVGLDREFSLSRLGIMLLYLGIVYLFFLRKKLINYSS